jgi:uncharacterized protein (UPF0548 family)
VFLLSKPTQGSIQSFINAQKDQPYSYAEVGASREGAPAGYNRDHNRIRLGTGKEVFDSAMHALRRWKMFAMPWVQLCWPDTPAECGATVAVLVSHLGFWSLNACRIIYVIEDLGRLQRYGFAYGTLPDHSERGEERFTVEYHSDDRSVWYDLLAFSRPGPVARFAYPVARRLQKRFARESQAAMQKATQSHSGIATSMDSK